VGVAIVREAQVDPSGEASSRDARPSLQKRPSGSAGALPSRCSASVPAAFLEERDEIGYVFALNTRKPVSTARAMPSSAMSTIFAWPPMVSSA
jgi:hypothetical protein